MTGSDLQRQLDRIEFGEVTFAIPAQKFSVSCAISTEETLPVVTEFAIRMIHACGTVSPEQLQTFFGFNEKETSSVIQTLVDERLVRWDQDQLGLTPQALGKFLESPDDVPRCFRIQEWSGDVYFELISFSPIKPSRGSGRSRALVDFRSANAEKQSRTVYWAERAFQEHFRRICKKNRAEIYKISEMAAGDRLAAPLSCTFTISLDGRAEIRRSLSDTTLEERIEFSQAISDELSKVRIKGNVGLNDFFELFKISLPDECKSAGVFEMSRYLDYVHVLGRNPFGAQTTPILGHLILTQNRRTISERLRLQPELGNAVAATEFAPRPICWLAPDVSFWGRTKAVRSFQRELEKILRPKLRNEQSADESSENDLLVPILIQPTRVPDDRARAVYRDAVQDGVVSSTKVLDGKVELFWVPGSFVVAMYHYHLDHPLAIPFGFLSSNPDHLRAARSLIVDDAIGTRQLYDLSNSAGGRGKDRTQELLKFTHFKE